jgi:hypothetical protein
MTDQTVLTGAIVGPGGEVETPMGENPPWLATVVFSTPGYAGPLHVDVDCYALNRSRAGGDSFDDLRESLVWTAFDDVDYCAACLGDVTWGHKLGEAGPADV